MSSCHPIRAIIFSARVKGCLFFFLDWARVCWQCLAARSSSFFEVCGFAYVEIFGFEVKDNVDKGCVGPFVRFDLDRLV